MTIPCSLSNSCTVYSTLRLFASIFTHSEPRQRARGN